MSFRRNFYFISCILVIFTALGLGNAGFSEETGDLVITEIAWMGTEASYADEWIEFYNATGSSVDLDGWSMYGASSGKCLNFSNADGSTTTEIEPYDYLIYAAHQNDIVNDSGTSLVDIWDTAIALNNSSHGEVILYDSSNCTGNVVDRVTQSDGSWFAGDNSEKMTMERVNYCKSGTDPDNWKNNDPEASSNGLDEDGNPIKGTPNAVNSVYQNAPPTAELTGPEECSPGEEVKLDAGYSEDPDGYIDSYRWDLDEDGNYDDGSGQTVSISCEDLEPVKVSLKVTDNYGASDFASFSVEPQRPFDVNAGKDITMKFGSSVILEGAVSGKEPDKPVSISWEMLDGPGESSWKVDDTGRVDPIFVPEKSGTYRLNLVASTKGGVQLSDEVTISVEQNPGVDEGGFAVEFVSESNRSFNGKTETGLVVELMKTDGPVRGSIIGYNLEKKPEFNLPETTPLSFRDLKVTNLSSGVAKVDFYYDQDQLDPNQGEEDLGLFYYQPEGGWIEANDTTVLPSKNYVAGKIPISDLKGTPLTVALEESTDSIDEPPIKTDELVVHGPNPVTEDGCIFRFDLPGDSTGGELKIYAVDGKLLYEEDISAGQERFPVDGRWAPAEINGNQLNSGIYFYR
ncbi:lamin tail domain-containing protein, partial [Candidatus Bipolaricaulota bacterium]|nr:lamin tail domain-containing protein [Candidatus Bipolaricaulota bacterium]